MARRVLSRFLPTISGFVVLIVVGLSLAGCPSSPTTAETQAADTTQIEAEAQQRLSQRDFGGAVAPLKRLANLSPTTPQIFDMLGMCVLRSGDPARFLTEARADLKRNPDDLAALTIAANALTGKENEKERLAYFRRLVELRPDDSGLRLTLAQELVNAFLYAEATPHLDTVLQTNPDEAIAYYLRGKVRFYSATTPDALAEAERDLKTALEKQPKFPWPYLYRGKVAIAQKKPKEALPYLQEAAKRMPGNAEVPFELARVYTALGKTDEATKAQTTFARLRTLELRCTTLVTRCGAFPNDFNLHWETTMALLEKGDAGQAEQFARRAAVLRPDDARVKALLQKFEAMRTGGGQ